MRRTSIVLTVVFLASALVAAQAPSQTPPPATPPAASSSTSTVPQASPTHAAAAEELLQVMKMEQATKQSADVMFETQLKQNPQLVQFKDIIQEFMTKYLGWQELKPEYVKLYTDLYTEPEIRQMIQFYGTPLGQKMQATMPQLMARSVEISQKRLQDHMPELQGKIMERVQSQQKQQQPQQPQPGAAPQGGQPGQSQPAPQGQSPQGQPSQPAPAPPPSTPPPQP